MIYAQDEQDLRHMRKALLLAAQAAEVNEIPVGAVIVLDGEMIGEGYNAPITKHDPTAHAEIVAMRAASKRIGNYRLGGVTLYVTLEPCPMCVGAMIHARVARLVFASYDLKTGAAGSAFDLLQDTRHNHVIRVTGGVMAAEASTQLKRFFERRRSVEI